MGGEPDAGNFDLELRIRPHDRFASPVRALCASVAAEQGFDVDVLRDLRIAVEDGFLSMVAQMAPANSTSTDDVVIVRLTASADRLEVEFATDVALPASERPLPVRRNIGGGGVIVTHGPVITLERVTNTASARPRT